MIDTLAKCLDFRPLVCVSVTYDGFVEEDGGGGHGSGSLQDGGRPGVLTRHLQHKGDTHRQGKGGTQDDRG
jgi:hypothetical protein